MMLKHPECPFKELVFTGECYLDKWYYVAGNGPVHEQATQIILLEKWDENIETVIIPRHKNKLTLTSPFLDFDK